MKDLKIFAENVEDAAMELGNKTKKVFELFRNVPT